MNVAQRRGKGLNTSSEQKHQTILVPTECNSNSSGGMEACNNPNHNHNHSHSHTIVHDHTTMNDDSMTNNSTSTTRSTLTIPTATATDTATATAAVSSTNANSNSNSNSIIVGTATVHHQYCGTGPFDTYWFNVDCCGIFCALLTYTLHCYAIYTVITILIPPWMNSDNVKSSSNGDTIAVTNHTSSTDILQQQQQLLLQQPIQHTHYSHSVSYMGIINILCFTIIAVLAMVSHYKAMTTDPGSVPPDAQPLLAVENVPAVPSNEKTNSSSNDTSNTDNTTNSNDISNNSNSNINKESNYQSAIQSYLLEPPPLKQQPIKRICRRCKTYKPLRAHHCSICRRCIIKMDHHCPWINNCVGINNHKYFLLFIFYTFISCLYTIILLIIRFTYCGSHSSNYQYYRHMHHNQLYRLNHPNSIISGQQQQQQQFMQNYNPYNNQQQQQQQHCFDEPIHLIYILGLLVEAILFGLFTFCMMMDQQDVVKSKMTHIDRYKSPYDHHDGGNTNNTTFDHNHHHHKSTHTTMSGFLEVFGVARPPTITIRHNKKINQRKITIGGSTISSLQKSNITTTTSTATNVRRLLRDGRFRLDWLSPFVPVCFPSITIRDEIIGFCRPCFSNTNYNNSKNNINTSTNSSINNNNATITELVPLNASFAKNITIKKTHKKGSNNNMKRKVNMEEII